MVSTAACSAITVTSESMRPENICMKSACQLVGSRTLAKGTLGSHRLLVGHSAGPKTREIT